MERRPIETRNQVWVRKVAGQLGRLGVRPNHVSLASIAFALIGAGIICWVSHLDQGIGATTDPTLGSNHSTLGSRLWLWFAALCVQLRLICNLLDGVIAVELGRGSPKGELYNEVPDRITDTLFFVALGWASQNPLGLELGWAASLAAMFTAYIRVLGKACGTPAYFWGPMAKPHRMALMTVILLIAPFLSSANRSTLYIGGLVAIGVFSLLTAWRRLAGVAKQLDEIAGSKK